MGRGRGSLGVSLLGQEYRSVIRGLDDNQLFNAADSVQRGIARTEASLRGTNVRGLRSRREARARLRLERQRLRLIRSEIERR